MTVKGDGTCRKVYAWSAVGRNWEMDVELSGALPTCRFYSVEDGVRHLVHYGTSGHSLALGYLAPDLERWQQGDST